jgi:pimeloyl-ACP methyl ester carboxylesterase
MSRPPLYVRRRGNGQPLLILLHGLGANGDVWERFVALLGSWQGRILIPDFRGHGRSPHANMYSDHAHAADVADLVRGEPDVYVIGHSMGGAVGLCLGDPRHSTNVAGVFAFGVKCAWTPEEINKVAAYARSPAKRFASRAEAAERFLRVSGLLRLVDADSKVVESGIEREGSDYRLSADPKTVGVVGTSVREVFEACRAPKWLACGQDDPMVGIEELRKIDPSAVLLGKNGHNIHVQDPQLLRDSIPFLATRAFGVD